MPAAVFTLLCAMAEARPDAQRKDRAPLLQLLLELKLAHPLVLPAITITTLASMRLSGKGKVAVQGVLG